MPGDDQPCPSKGIQGSGKCAHIAWILYLIQSENQGQRRVRCCGEQIVKLTERRIEESGDYALMANRPLLAAVCLPGAGFIEYPGKIGRLTQMKADFVCPTVIQNGGGVTMQAFADIYSVDFAGIVLE